MANEVKLEQIKGTHVVSPRGELDAFTAPPLRTMLIDLIETGSRHLVVDLTDVTFLDSTALGALVAAHKHMRERGGLFSIVVPSAPAARIFELTGLATVLDLRAGRDSELA